MAIDERSRQLGKQCLVSFLAIAAIACTTGSFGLPYETLLGCLLSSLVILAASYLEPAGRNLGLVALTPWLVLPFVFPVFGLLFLGGVWGFCSREQSSRTGELLRQYGLAATFLALLYLLVSLPVVQLAVNDLSYWLSDTIYKGFGEGGILGAAKFGWQPFVIAIVVSLPLKSSLAWRPASWAIVGLQLGVVGLCICFRHLLPDATAELCSLASAGVSRVVLASGEHTSDWILSPKLCVRAGASFGAGCLLTFVGWYAPAKWSGTLVGRQSTETKSVLFLHTPDHENNMGVYTSPGVDASEEEFIEHQSAPAYDVLAQRFLPSLGVSVAVKTLDECDPAEFGEYDLVAMICVQDELPPEHIDTLLRTVFEGRVNLLLVGDHTDIGGVQGPFNSIGDQIGIHLAYDSVFPLTDRAWDGVLTFHPHPILGSSFFAPRALTPGLGISVGASLNLDSSSATPLITVAEGYSDRGTPNAPELAGLGDRLYTLNEQRGGQVIAAECLYGDGTIVAFGDTAFLQNTSVCKNFSFCASLFGYLTQHPNAKLMNSAKLLTLASMIGLTLICCIRTDYFVVAITTVALLLASHVFSAFYEPQELIEEILDRQAIPLVVLDQDRTTKSDEDDITVLSELISVSSGSLLLETSVADTLDHLTDYSAAPSFVMIGGRQHLSQRQQDALLACVDAGSSLLVSSGYLEGSKVGSLLAASGCQISPVTVGGGQRVATVLPGFAPPPPLVESWALELEADWQTIVTCFGRPIIARRDYGDGQIYVVSDSFAMLDRASRDSSFKIRVEIYDFYHQLFGDLLSQAAVQK